MDRLRLISAWLLCPALAVGQASAPKTTFEITSRIVYVDVVVRDRSGHIVRGLTEKDFRVIEDGKTQKIDFFRDHTLDAPPAAGFPARQDDPLSFSNVDATGEASSSVNIILFDFFNTAPSDYGYARKQMIHFLENLPPGRQTALFVLGPRLRMLQSFTGSTDRLLAAAKAMKMEVSLTETLGEQQQDIAFGQAFARAVGRSASTTNPVSEQNSLAAGEDAEQAYDVTKLALQQLGAAVSGYPGRKNLFWLSDNFPGYGGVALELHDAAHAVATNSLSTQDMADYNRGEATEQIAIYPISLLGLEAGGMGAESNIDPENGRELARQSVARISMHEQLNNLASTTGGHAYYGTNDFAGALARGFEDGSSYYQLAYRPENHQWNGHFRNINVKVAERSYSLSYRRGYYALPDQPAATDPARTLEMALQPDTPEATMLRLRGRVQLPDGPGEAVKVNAVIDPGNVSFVTDAKGRHHAHLMVMLIAMPDPLPLNVPLSKAQVKPPQVSGMYVVDLDATEFEKLLVSGMPMQQQLKLSPGSYRLRLGVYDLESRRAGTLDMPIAVSGQSGQH